MKRNIMGEIDRLPPDWSSRGTGMGVHYENNSSCGSASFRGAHVESFKGKPIAGGDRPMETNPYECVTRVEPVAATSHATEL